MTSRDYGAEVSDLVDNLKELVGSLVAELEKANGAIEKTESRVKKLEGNVQTKDSKIDRLERTITELKEKAVSASELAEKNEELQAELDAIQEQLERMSETYRELVAKTEADIPVQELLALYIALLEDVFAAQPHAVALFLLHGAKTKMTRDEIIKTSGHTPAAIRKALGDLARADLVDYDVETGAALLKKRILSG